MPQVPLAEVARLFLRLGTTAFGGPAAHIAMMEDEVVRRRGWVTRDEFLDLLSAANLIPGPNSTELAIHLGHRVAGRAGLVVAGACFIVPAVLIVGAIAWAYTTWGQLPEVGAVLMGVKPVIIAVVLQALWGLLGKAAPTWPLRILGLACLALSALGVNELWLLLGAGVGMAAARGLGGRAAGVAIVPVALASATQAVSVGPWPIFGFFLKVGSVLYGSGYVLLAFLRGDLVERWHWLTQAQLLDAVAVGQVTPGPVFTTATFIGYVLGGPLGAMAATAGIFLPAFVFVALSGPLVPRLRQSPTAGAFLDGVNVASVALMAAVTWPLATTAIRGPVTAALALASAVLLIRYRVNSVWLVAGGAIAGLAASALGWR